MARRRRTKADDAAIGWFILIAIIIGVGKWIFDVIQANVEVVVSVLCVGGGVGALALVARAGTRRAERVELQRHLEARRLEYQRQEEAENEARLFAARQRRETLLAQFGDEQVADGILAGEIWHDMSREQLLESWGEPDVIDEKVLKTKVKETFKYDRIGVNRFARRAYLENNVVVGWERS